MKTKIDAVIVVEGKSDVAFLSSFIDASFYVVNGSAVSEDDFNYLLKLKENHNLIILTDPDYPGMQIRKKINNKVPDCYNAYIKKDVSIKKNKVGVAESTKEEILHALNNLKLYKKFDENKSILTMSDLYDLKLNGGKESKNLRLKLCEYLGIGYSNGKELLNKLNLLSITKEKLEEALKNVEC